VSTPQALWCCTLEVQGYKTSKIIYPSCKKILSCRDAVTQAPHFAANNSTDHLAQTSARAFIQAISAQAATHLIMKSLCNPEQLCKQSIDVDEQ
jgi:hypothetical protein